VNKADHKQQSNGSNTVISTLAADGLAVTFGTARRGLGKLQPRPVPTASVPTSYYSMWHYKLLILYYCLFILCVFYVFYFIFWLPCDGE